jgi:hypothetical protein
MLKTARSSICDYVQNNPNFFDDIKYIPTQLKRIIRDENCFCYFILIDKFDFDLQKYTDDIKLRNVHRSYRTDDYHLYVCNLFEIVYNIIVFKYDKKIDDEFFKYIFTDYFQELYKPYYSEFRSVYFDMLKTLFDNSQESKKSKKIIEVKYKQCLKKQKKIEKKETEFFDNRGKYIKYEEYLFYKEIDISQSIYEYIEKRCIDFLNNFSENSIYRVRNRILYLDPFKLNFDDCKKLL